MLLELHDKPIRIWKVGACRSGIGGRPVPLFELPPLDIMEPRQKVGWHKFKYSLESLPNPNIGYST